MKYQNHSNTRFVVAACKYTLSLNMFSGYSQFLWPLATKERCIKPFKIPWAAYIRKNIYPVQLLSNIYIFFHLLWPLVIINFSLQSMSSLFLQKCSNIWPQQTMAASGCKNKFINIFKKTIIPVHR